MTAAVITGGFVAAVLLCLALSSLAVPSAAEAATPKIVYIASLDWPPYTINNNNNAGASQEVVKQAFAAMGYTAITQYFPWARAVELGMQSQQYEGYYPAYKSPDRVCTFSDAIGVGPMGLASRKADHLSGKGLDDLRGITIGTVQGYVETEAFDNRVKQGLLKVEPATYDVLNLRKLVVGHLKLAVIDKNVMTYLLATDPDLKGKGDLLTFDGSAMEEKSLHICFKNTDEGRSIAAIFNAGLKKIDIQAVADAGLKAAAEAAGAP